VGRCEDALELSYLLRGPPWSFANHSMLSRRVSEGFVRISLATRNHPFEGLQPTICAPTFTAAIPIPVYYNHI
jgi:hypothetical protein